jgi:hypothetical protein
MGGARRGGHEGYVWREAPLRLTNDPHRRLHPREPSRIRPSRIPEHHSMLSRKKIVALVSADYGIRSLRSVHCNPYHVAMFAKHPHPSPNTDHSPQCQDAEFCLTCRKYEPLANQRELAAASSSGSFLAFSRARFGSCTLMGGKAFTPV